MDSLYILIWIPTFSYIFWLCVKDFISSYLSKKEDSSLLDNKEVTIPTDFPGENIVKLIRWVSKEELNEK